MSENAPPPASPRKMKKLPFKPTALRRPPQQQAVPSESEPEGLALFRRAKEMEPIVAADQERRMRKRQKLDEERRRREKESHDEDDDENATPRKVDSDQTLSREPSSPSKLVLASGALQSPVSHSGKDCFSPQATTEADSTPTLVDTDPFTKDAPLTPRHRSRSSVATPCCKAEDAPLAVSSNAQPISLDSDSESDSDDAVVVEDALPKSLSSTAEADATPAPLAESPQKAVNNNDDGDDDVSDSEIGQYVRRAKEQLARDAAFLENSAKKSGTREAVDILVTSMVPGAVPCRVKFRYDQALRLIRDNWVALQRRHDVSLPSDDNNDFVLTWRRAKVFNCTNLLTLGIRPRGDERVQVGSGGGNSSGLTDDCTRIHMEVWTLDLFRAMEHEEERRRKREAGELSDSDDDDDRPHGSHKTDGDAESAAASEVKLRVILRAKGMQDVKLTVRSDTTAETLVTGFRAQRGIGSDRAVSVLFEGDRLDEHVTMEEAEVADMDLLDVLVQ